MSINKKYVMTGMLATALVVPMTDVTNSYADDTEIMTLNSTNEMYVNTSAGLNVRKGPSTSYSVITTLPKGTKVNVITTSGDWSKITSGSVTGYVSNKYLSSSSSSTGSSETSVTKYVNASVGLNVRKGPSTSYSVITKLANGTQVTVKSTSNGWSKITSGSITGYVSSSYLTSSKPIDNDESSNETSITKYVDASVGLNVRKGPGTSYSVITKLANGTQVTVKSTSNGWSKITSGSITGYVSSSYLTSSKPTTEDESSNEISETKYVEASVGLNVRKGPGTNYSVITKLANGTQVTVKSTSNGWSKITSGSVTGYVSSSYLTSKAPSTGSSSDSSTSTTTSASKVISYAKSLLGKPYVWGAQGPNGFDCSGFTYYVFKNAAGISLPRTSSQQSNFGTYVSKSNLKPGDLVFFDTVGPNNGVVTHCGIYIGDGQLIHAASGQGKVTINNMNSSYYINTYVNARRVL